MKDVKTYIIIILCVLLLALQIRSCNYENRIADLKAATETATTKLGMVEQEYWVQRQKDSGTIATQKQLILSQEDAIKTGILKMEGITKEMSKIQSQLRIATKTIIDSFNATYAHALDVDTSDWGQLADEPTDRKDSIAVPAKFFSDKKNKYYFLSGTVRKTDVHFDSIAVYNEQQATYGYKKAKGFFRWFKPDTAVVSVSNSNPYLRVTGMNNLVIKPKTRWYQSRVFYFLLGMASYQAIRLKIL